MSENPPFPPFKLEPTTEAPPEKAKREKKAKTDISEAPPKRRAASLKAHAPKFDLQTTLAAAKLLSESDFPLFEKLIIALDDAGKPARDRVLAAVTKVFG